MSAAGIQLHLVQTASSLKKLTCLRSATVWCMKNGRSLCASALTSRIALCTAACRFARPLSPSSSRHTACEIGDISLAGCSCPREPDDAHCSRRRIYIDYLRDDHRALETDRAQIRHCSTSGTQMIFEALQKRHAVQVYVCVCHDEDGRRACRNGCAGVVRTGYHFCCTPL
jgi:hypothetical protein